MQPVSVSRRAITVSRWLLCGTRLLLGGGVGGVGGGMGGAGLRVLATVWSWLDVGFVMCGRAGSQLWVRAVGWVGS